MIQILLTIMALMPLYLLSQNHFLIGKDNQFFIENRGQWHHDVLYLCRMGGLDAWVTKYGINFTFYKVERAENRSMSGFGMASASDTVSLSNCSPTKLTNHRHTEMTNKQEGGFGTTTPTQPLYRNDHEDTENIIILGHRVLYELQNHNPNPQTEGKHQQYGYYNYFKGNDLNKHATYVGLYKEVIVKNVYNGIDIRYYFDKGFLRYDYIVHPGADPSQIKFKLRGQYNDWLTTSSLSNGTLSGFGKLTNHSSAYRNDPTETIRITYSTRFGEVALTELHTYQANTTIPSRFVKQGDIYTFALNNYDQNKDLIIDPIIFSTFLGGSTFDEAFKVTTDDFGNAFITGITTSIDFDTTAGVFQTLFAGNSDVFITKINPNGNTLIFSTYLGGTNLEESRDIFVDSTGIYIAGYTASIDFVTSTNAFQNSYGGGTYDVFVTKIHLTGSSLLFSTFLGGSGNDISYAIAVDNSQNIYITGQTSSSDFNLLNPLQSSKNGHIDAFITQLNKTGSQLLYSSYLGGSNNDIGFDIAVDNSLNAYITGYTSSTDFYITSNAYQTNHAGADDIFVTKMNLSGTNYIMYSTYIGGSLSDLAPDLVVDDNGFIYVSGRTNSMDFPTTPGSFQNINQGNYDAFISKLDTNGTNLIFSTYLGGSSFDAAIDITSDNSGNIYIVGFTTSLDFDTTHSALQTFNAGNEDVFISQLNHNGTALIYSTYLGGTLSDIGTSIALHSNSQHLVITGYTNSNNYYTSQNAFQSTKDGDRDIFVTRLCFLQNISVALISSLDSERQSVCINNPIDDITYNITGTPSIYYIGLPPGVTIDFNGNLLNIHGTPTSSGIFNYTITLIGCDTFYLNGSITVDFCTNNDKFSFDKSFMIYPNPNQEQFTIQTNSEAVFELIDMTGKVLNNYTVKAKETINISLPTGMYFIREKESGITQKIIVQ